MLIETAQKLFETAWHVASPIIVIGNYQEKSYIVLPPPMGHPTDDHEPQEPGTIFSFDKLPEMSPNDNWEDSLPDSNRIFTANEHGDITPVNS